MTQLTHKQQQLFNALSIVVGNAMYALTVVLFLMPSGLITGGATGIAPVSYTHLTLPTT